MFNRQWWWTTLLVLAAVAVMARLGIWQLDRLAQRRQFNARVQVQLEAPILDLNAGDLPANLGEMEYRAVMVRGEYDHSQQVVLRNQAWGNQPGVHLITPLRIESQDQAVLVDRGWVPVENFYSGDLDQYNEPGMVIVRGVVRRSQTRPDFGRRTDPLRQPGERLLAWNLMDIGRMEAQMGADLLSAYVQQAPEPAWDRLPHRSQPELDLTEGPHLGYAGQWFLFALVLLGGYPFYVRRHLAEGRLTSRRTRSIEELRTGVPPQH